MNNKYLKPAMLAASTLVLAACSSSDDDPLVTPPPPTPPPVMLSFDVTISNLTAAQPLSPVAVIAHEAAWNSGFATGEAVSEAQEQLAEGGDNSALISAADDDATVHDTAAGSDPVGPGATATVSLQFEQSDDMQLSVFTMLVNTNDTVTLLQDIDLAALENGDSISMNARSYDAGTEANSETAATIPGPVGNGEGFNADRDDVRDAAYLSPGVVTADDGLAGSALSQLHRWDNPVMRVTISRTQ